MKKLKTVAKIAIIIILILGVSIFICNYTDKSNADAGYHSSYSSGGSSSSGSYSGSSSSSSSSSSSRDRSSSYSSSSRDRSSSYSSSSSSSSYSSSNSKSGNSNSSKREDSILYKIIKVPIIIICIICTVVACIATCIYLFIYTYTIVKYFVDLIKGNSKTKNKIIIKNNENAIQEIKKYKPEFDKDKFLLHGYYIFVRIEKAWMNFDLESVRDCITDEMFNMYESQLMSMEMNGEQNIMKGFKLLNSAITEAKKQNNILEVKARYAVEFCDYIINKETKQVLRGNSNKKIKMVYEFTFIEDVENKQLDKCPNCGAPININAGTFCKYCGSKIVDDSKNFVMSKKVSLSQE